MPATKAYTRVNFENYPSTNTPLNATNLNKVDKGIDDLDDLLVTARNNIETLQSNATTDEANILALQGSVAALNGFTYYSAGEVNLVALVANDSFYKDANDKYVLADSATGQSMIDNVTYKALASTEDTRGEVGADSVTPFSTVKDINSDYSSQNIFINTTTELSSIPIMGYSKIGLYRLNDSVTVQYRFLNKDGSSTSLTSLVISPTVQELSIPNNAMLISITASLNRNIYYGLKVH